MLDRLPLEHRSVVCDAYSRVYDEMYKAEPVEFKKDGAARGAANTRLREYVERRTGVRL